VFEEIHEFHLTNLEPESRFFILYPSFSVSRISFQPTNAEVSVVELQDPARVELRIAFERLRSVFAVRREWLHVPIRFERIVFFARLETDPATKRLEARALKVDFAAAYLDVALVGRVLSLNKASLLSQLQLHEPFLLKLINGALEKVDFLRMIDEGLLVGIDELFAI